MTKCFDGRPICTCTAYPFPHRVGGRCTGSAFAEFYFYHDHQLCSLCNCNGDNQCEVVTGQESIKEAECYDQALDIHNGGHLPLQMEDILPPEEY